MLQTLRIVYGPPAALALGEGPVAIGRERADGMRTLVVNDPEVSRRHATLTFDAVERVWCLLDAGSTNGTRVDGRRAAHVRLAHGSVIRAGKTVILYTEGTDAPVPPPLPIAATGMPTLNADVAEAMLIVRQRRG